MQFVEHLDAGGIYGSFLDLLEHAEKNVLDSKGSPGKVKICGTTRNLKIPALMIPPEHLARTQGLVQNLRAIIRENDSAST